MLDGGNVTPEGRIQAEVRLALGQIPRVALWRNTVGHAEIYEGPGRIRHLTYGLCPGSADLVGVANGRFVGLEIKTPRGVVDPEQERWLALVEAAGGVGIVVRSADEAVQTLMKRGVIP